MKRLYLLVVASFVAGAVVSGAAVTAFAAKVPQPSPTPLGEDPYGMSFAEMSSSLKQKDATQIDHYTLYYLLSIDQNTIALLRKVRSDAKRPELRAYADRLTQQRSDEVDQMFAWQKAWGYSHH